MPLWDPRFKYIPASKTDITTTWRRFGFRPTTDNERRKRQRGGLAAGAGTRELGSADAAGEARASREPTLALVTPAVSPRHDGA